MGDQIVVLPFDHVALLDLDRHRIKLKILHRNLNDGGGYGRFNGFGRSVTIACAARISRACATDNYRKPADAEKPESQHSVTRARLASFSLN